MPGARRPDPQRSPGARAGASPAGSPRSSHPSLLQLEFGGVLGIGTDRYPIPWALLTYDVEKDGDVVPLRDDQLSQAPRYAQGDSPTYNDDYGRRVYEHYGVVW